MFKNKYIFFVNNFFSLLLTYQVYSVTKSTETYLFRYFSKLQEKYLMKHYLLTRCENIVWSGWVLYGILHKYYHWKELQFTRRKYVTIPSQENTIDINVSFLSNNILNYCLENFRKLSSRKYFEFDSENVLKDFNGSTRNKSWFLRDSSWLKTDFANWFSITILLIFQR